MAKIGVDVGNAILNTRIKEILERAGHEIVTRVPLADVQIESDWKRNDRLMILITCTGPKYIEAYLEKNFATVELLDTVSRLLRN